MKTKNKVLAKQVKKLIFSNRYTFNDISLMLEEPLEDCIAAFESYYNSEIPPSLLIVGNRRARKNIKTYIEMGKTVYVYGENGIGKDISIKRISKDLGLILRKVNPYNQEQIIQEFGKAPFKETDFLFVIDIDSLKMRKYAILKKYATENVSPVVLIGKSRDSLHKRILSKLKAVGFTEPSVPEVETFLKKKYNWDGDIKEIYDPDMRVVISRVLNDAGQVSTSLQEEETIGAKTLAFNLSCGFAKPEDFENCEDPLWWALRWLAYNQAKKFPRDTEKRLDNLEKLSYIDQHKYLYDKKILRGMLMGLNPSPRRTRFSFPPWPRKQKKKKEKKKRKKTKSERRETETVVEEDIDKKLEQVDFSQWM